MACSEACQVGLIPLASDLLLLFLGDLAVDGGDVLFLRTTGGVADAAFDQRGNSAEGGRALGSRNGPSHVGGLVGVLVSCDAAVSWDPLYSNGGITATELLAQVVDRWVDSFQCST